jgi:hypothetical protein
MLEAGTSDESARGRATPEEDRVVVDREDGRSACDSTSAEDAARCAVRYTVPALLL